MTRSREEVAALLTPNFADRFAGFWPADGWLDLIVEIHEHLVAVDPDYRIAQIKEKFGGLRYYTDGFLPLETREWLSRKEQESYTICQQCGARNDSVALRQRGWVATLCDDCDSDDADRGYELDL